MPWAFCAQPPLDANWDPSSTKLNLNRAPAIFLASQKDMIPEYKDCLWDHAIAAIVAAGVGGRRSSFTRESWWRSEG